MGLTIGRLRRLMKSDLLGSWQYSTLRPAGLPDAEILGEL
jgi:hypothetical protein